MSKATDFATPFAWGLDFLRAYHERPRLLRWIARMCMGRYAYRELVGMHAAFQKEGYDPDFPYGLEHMDYHREDVHAAI